MGNTAVPDDEEIIERGIENVKKILADNYVRPDEAQKVLSKLRQQGSHTIIDMVTVDLNLRYDEYEASFSNLGLTGIPISEDYAEKYDRLLCGGIWCIVQLEYDSGEDAVPDIISTDGERLQSKRKRQKDTTPISIRKLTPIQSLNVNMDDLKAGRSDFTKEEWLDVLMRSIGMAR